MKRPAGDWLRMVILFVGGMLPAVAVGQVQPPQPFGAVPTPEHLPWHELEFYGFIHFSLNTFTDREWGGGDESPQLFQPEQLDADQWARVARAAGMTALILTAKHHDGFCLWPSKYTEHSVKNAPWKGGQGDVVRAVADACRKHNLKFGIYLSPWDRNHAEYGRPAYLTYFRNQLRELLTEYGEVFETWYDGANGGSGYYGGANETRRIDNRTYYDWPTTWRLVRELQPGNIRFSDGGPDIRWVGNESGTGYDPNWATFNREGRWPGHADNQSLRHGDQGGTHWVPAECDVSIRPGWFWHESQDAQVKTVPQLLDIYYASVGRGCNLLLNIPPDRRGLLHETDVSRLQELGKVLRETFATDLARGRPATADRVRGDSEQFGPQRLTDGDRQTYWAADDDVRQAVLEVDLGRPVEFDRVRIQEHIPLGQRVERFTVQARVDGQWQQIGEGSTIGPRRILCTPRVTADRVRVELTQCLACPTLSTIEVYCSPATSVRIVALGDSITNGARLAGVTEAETFREITRRELTERLGKKVEVLNAGVNGDIVTQALQRLETDVLDRRPDVVTVMFGGNDAGFYRPQTNSFADTPRVERQQFRAALATLVDRLRTAGITVVLMTCPPMTERYGGMHLEAYRRHGVNFLVQDYVQTTREVAAEKQVPLVDVYRAFAGNRERLDYFPDGLHPDARGHRAIADLLVERLANILAPQGG